MKLLKAVLAFELMLGLTFLLLKRLGHIPPLGDLLNPSTGIWNNSEPGKMKDHIVVNLTGMGHETTVRYDNYMIPHIFAATDYDLYFSQGYVTARDRLWQMDIQARTAAGRVSEVLGPDLLNQDRYYRRIGLPYAAERSLAFIMKDSIMRNVLEAYTAGVNAYISRLSPSEYPVEFKLMGYSPETWKPLNCILIFKLMAETLSSGSSDFKMSATLKQFGSNITQNLFPDQPFLSDPIVPEHTPWDFIPQKIPAPPVPALAENSAAFNFPTRPEGIGSNNWAIAGSRSKSGYPLLANDPHLNLTLPAIWYQIQMAAPNLNVYGVSIPGVPCIIIGYNQKIAWGLTNSGADVQDWYRVRFSDPSKKQYWYDDKWNQVTKRIEIIKVRGGKNVSDTISYTHQGPIARQAGPWEKLDDETTPIAYALRWVVHDESKEIKTFYLLNHGKDFNDYKEALQYFSSPPQNIIFASTEKDIAITSSGKYPLRYHDQGKFLLDGGSRAADWYGWIPPEQDPAIRNPARGFLSSANQPPTDSSYPYYISWQFGSSERAKRINSWLSGLKNATVDSLRALQNDTYSVLAAEILPAILPELGRQESEHDRAALNEISRWDYHFDSGSIGATIFNMWWDILYNDIWSDEFDKKGIQLSWPSRDRTERLLLKEKDAPWYDDVRTPQKETRTMIINRTFVKTIDSLRSKFGPMGENWRWGFTRKCRISHMAGIDAFSIGPYVSSGAPNTVDALSENFGPSWRMIVELGPRIKAYGIFPGGESGNPGSYYYDNFFTTWKDGKLNELIFLLTKDDLPGSIKSTLTLN